MLPYSNYKWLPEYHLSTFNPLKTDLAGDKGFILEVDLEYPENLHYHHNDFPLAPESNEISLDDLSKYSRDCFLESNNNANYKSTKLTSTCFNREKYIVHIKN